MYVSQGHYFHITTLYQLLKKGLLVILRVFSKDLMACVSHPTIFMNKFYIIQAKKFSILEKIDRYQCRRELLKIDILKTFENSKRL